MKISVIVPVRNEEALIAESLEQLKKSDSRFPIEIIVVDGQSVDRTKRIASRLADHVIDAEAGRARQMHQGALQASGEIFVFLHADTQLPENWQEPIAKYFAPENQNGTVAAAFKLGFDSEKLFYKGLAALANFRTRLTGIPYGDQALIVPRKIYFEAGGFPDVPLMEEYLMIPRLRRIGKLKILDEKVRTSSRKYERRGPLRNALKNFCFALLFQLGVSPQKLAEWY